jgi:serine/threonine protein kinase
LGEGANGKVYLMVDTDTGDKFVVKIINANTLKEKVNVAREIVALKQIKPVCQKYLMCLKNVKKTGDKTIISIDYLENSHELQTYLENHFLEMTIFPKFVLMQKLLLGLAQLHAVGVVHKDIKPANILIVDKKLAPHYIDYGFACVRDNIKCLNRRAGTPLYVAPEMLEDSKMSFESNKSADVWSLGVVFIALCFGSSLWEAKTKRELYRMIENSTNRSISENLDNSARIFIEENKNVNPKEISFMKKLIRPMLDRKHIRRPSANDMLRKFAKANSELLFLAKSRSLNIPKSAHKAVLKLTMGGGSEKVPERVQRVAMTSMRDIKPKRPLYGV